MPLTRLPDIRGVEPRDLGEEPVDLATGGPASQTPTVPFPQQITRFNRDVVNPRMRHLARIAPYLGVVHHVGRKSGKTYVTPVMVFRAQSRWLFALTYGSQVDWARNVVAAGRKTVANSGTGGGGGVASTVPLPSLSTPGHDR